MTLMMVGFCWASLAWGQPPSPIPQHQSTYTVFYNGDAIGNIEFLLEPANASVWYVKTTTEPTSTLAKLFASSVTEASHFVWQEHSGQLRIIPLTYHQVSKEPFRTRFWQHRYDWQAMRTQTSTHEGEQTLELIDGLIDPLTLRLQLAAELLQQPTAHIDRSFVVLDRDDIETQRMDHIGQAQIEVPAGCFDAEHYHRFRKEGSSRNYDLWVAPQLYWLPIRMAQEDGGRRIVIELSESDLLDSQPDCGN